MSTEPQMSKFVEGQFVVGSSSADYWESTRAKTLTGAKRVASKMFQPSVGGKIEVGLVRGSGDLMRTEAVAIKYGYGAWQQV